MDEPFWGQDIAVVDVEWVGGDSAVLIKHCSSTGDLEWAQQVTADEARGVCWYLARLFGQELHPAGTAAKLQELAKERDEAEVVRSDRRRLLAENAELRREAAENARALWRYDDKTDRVRLNGIATDTEDGGDQ